MKPYQLIVPLLAIPFVAAAQGQEKSDTYKPFLVQNFCACACDKASKNDSESLSIQNYVAEQELKKSRQAIHLKQKPFSRTITNDYGDPDLVW